MLIITNITVLTILNKVTDDPKEEKNATKVNFNSLAVKNGSSRAQSLEELQNRLKAIKGKKKLNYKEKLLKKGLKSKIKKKNKKEERVMQQKLVRIEKTNGQIKPDPELTVKTRKPIFNSEGKIVFSKFDFTGLGTKHEKKKEKDPKKILENMEKQKEKLKNLEAQGEKEKATELKEKFAWKNALAKAEGEKVKDDPILLKKSIKKKDDQKKSSKKKWDVRKEGVKKAQDEKQRKRTENLAKRKKEKKVTKLKKAAKRGRIIPGF